jgi:hypothetical protein
LVGAVVGELLTAAGCATSWVPTHPTAAFRPC